MGNKKRNMDTTSKDKSDIARDIEFHFYGHRFPVFREHLTFAMSINT
ncbi:hypothetical protein NIES3804_35600 [Microcystis aeruginosa NIES-3804]|uniref:Uncharacterized protein n=1 Tax=Microcystis aeruginosa NIES-3804 TaxID=2517783 RepID=A0A6H9H060_MICAE|nr:hypothetical protein NIES3804_35600 [Microcystis aeruginosa NIES-3804]